MPANRSRTLRWRECLEQIQQRGGAIEIAVARDYPEPERGRHLVWRVRVLEVREEEMVVEQPVALGQLIPIQSGAELVVILAVGQNRWMFMTHNLGPAGGVPGPRALPSMRLRLPAAVERCQRRHHYRVETTAINFPEIEIWPLLDPKSVLPAERANALQLAQESAGPGGGAAMRFEDLMPEVGPRFSALLLNLGGGGVGLRVAPHDASNLSRHKLFWLRISLPPDLSVPICATAKLIHTHVDSSQHVYAGLAFDFAFNPAHQQVLIQQICRFISRQQQVQSQRQVRRTA